MGLTPEQAARQITTTPQGQFDLYDAWRPPDFRSLIKVAQTEQGKSEVSCVLEEIQRVVMAKPMILSDETRPTNFTFANQVGVQIDERASSDVPLDELGRAIQSHLWLANLIWKCHLAPRLPCDHVINFQVATATTSRWTNLDDMEPTLT